MLKKTKLKIAVFLDGRPGHEKQSLGVVNCLKKSRDVECVTFKTTKNNIAYHLRDWLKFYFSPLFLTNKTQSLDYDFIIGTGTATHLPMLELKKKSAIPIISCMTPSQLLIKYFALLFVPFHDKVAKRDNIFITIGPPNTCVNKKNHDNNRILILLGGVDSNSHIWDTSDIVRKIEQLIPLNPNKDFIISSSPRTPQDTIERVLKLSEKHGSVTFYDYKETPSGWVENEYDSCKFVWVSSDSISMVYEALSAGCCVGIIPVKWKNKKSKFLRSEQYLQNKGYIISHKNYLDGQGFSGDEVILNEAEKCADEIIRRWL